MLRNLNQSSSGQRVCGTPKSGVLGSLIPATGDSGAGYTYNDLSLPADNAREICGRITTWPLAGTLTAYEDTSFEFVAPDGAYSFQYQLYVDGVATGSPVTVSLQVGPVTHTSSGDLIASVALMSGVATRFVSHASSADLVASAAVMDGAAARNAVTITHTSSGDLAADAALIAGVAARSGSFSGSLSPADIAAIAAAVLATLQATPIPVNTVLMNSAPIIGDGSEADRWRGFGVPN